MASPATFIAWLLQFLAHFFQHAPKQLHNKSHSIFSCDTCQEPLNTIHRFDDKSYCKSCRADIDSDDDAFSD